MSINHSSEHRIIFNFLPSKINYQEFVDLITDALAPYISNNFYHDEDWGVCIDCIQECLKINKKTELILPEWEIKKSCSVISEEDFGKSLVKGRKYRFRTSFNTEGSWGNWTLDFEDVT